MDYLLIGRGFNYFITMAGIRHASMFRGLGPEELREIEGRLRIEKRKKRDVIFSEGDSPDWLYIVMEGKVKITKLSQEGKELILEVISPGEMFGGVAVVKGFPYPGNAVAMEDSALIKIARPDFLEFLKKFPTLLERVLEELGARLQDSHESRKNIALEKVISRIAALLVKLSEKAGRSVPGGTAIDLKLTKQDIAEMVGTTVETSIRTMSRLKKQGIIEERDGTIIIKDLPGLKDLSA